MVKLFSKNDGLPKDWRSRIKSPQAWAKMLAESAICLVLALMAIQALKVHAPGYPIIVRTPSLQEGLFWLDLRDKSFARGDVVSFPFEPTQVWIRERYWFPGLAHTKRIVAVAGDQVRVNAGLELEVCTAQGKCNSRGLVRKEDSQGKPMTSWVQPGGSYTLQPGEVWVAGDHPSSLDSRYHGPIQVGQLNGKASLLIGWGSASMKPYTE